MTVVLKLGNWAELGKDAYAIRHQVFVLEQGVPEELEHDENDATALHILLFEQATPIATGRLLLDGHIGRVAVLAQHRGKGHGHRLMQELIVEARQRGHRVIELHAQTAAQHFYAALGFVATGDDFIEAGIAHVQMRKTW